MNQSKLLEDCGVNLRKLLITWSKYRNTAGYPVVVAILASVLWYEDFLSMLLCIMFALAPAILSTLHSIISAIESFVMTNRGYRYWDGFEGRGAYSPAWVHETSLEEKYVLVSIDGHSNSRLK